MSPHNSEVRFKEPAIQEQIKSPEDVREFFAEFPHIEPDSIVRPHGDTTLFTSAGVQHLETIERTAGELRTTRFVVAQPVIRSQFMDRVREGTSTAFVNFSVGIVDATQKQYKDVSDRFLSLLASYDISETNIRTTTEHRKDTWGNKKFHASLTTFYINNIEVGENVFIEDYPINTQDTVGVIDLGFGVERLNWALRPDLPYLSAHAQEYKQSLNKDTVAACLDPLRTMVLIAGEGILPSQKNHGYRLRQFSKRYIQRRIDGINTENAIGDAYAYWKKWGWEPSQELERIVSVIQNENQRNLNGFILQHLQSKHSITVQININQSTAAFFDQLKHSIPVSIINNLQKTLYE